MCSAPPFANIMPRLIFTAFRGGVASTLQVKKLGLREDKWLAQRLSGSKVYGLSGLLCRPLHSIESSSLVWECSPEPFLGPATYLSPGQALREGGIKWQSLLSSDSQSSRGDKMKKILIQYLTNNTDVPPQPPVQTLVGSRTCYAFTQVCDTFYFSSLLLLKSSLFLKSHTI